jgi:hypothetical protein
MKTILRRRWVVPSGAALIAVGLFVAGVVAWGMTATTQHVCPDGVICGLFPPDQTRQIHPLRAEILWALSGVFMVAAVVSVARPLDKRRGQSPVSAH